MKKTIYVALSCAGAALLLPAAGLTADNVCSEGVGIPPFLSSGAKPNLLMVLDNSGSMLDAAYSKQGKIYQADGTTPVWITTNTLQAQYQRCMDGDYDIVDVSNNGSTRTLITTVTGYDNTYSYGGYFKNDVWYTWADVTDTYRGSEWKSGISYAIGNRVQAFGNIYEATTAGTSTGATIDKDTGVTWRKLSATVPSLTQWGAGITYPAKSFTWYGPQLYYTAAGGTSTGTALTANTGVTDWKPVEHTWMSTESYSSGSIVSYKGILYQSLVGSNQNNVPGKDSAKWQSLRQGGFTPLASAPASATAACSGSGTKYTRDDALCLTIDSSGTPAKVTSFVARGNFLNWATASKFDIEKKILTGGKHNYYEQVLVAEHRGCSGSRMMKQVKMVKASDSTVSYLTLGVRGGKYEDDSTYFRKDRVDSSDDTTRLEVMAVTALGMQISGQCQDMLDHILTQDPNGANWGQKITSCLATMPKDSASDAITHQRPMLNHSLQFCSKWWKDNSERNIGTIAQECQKLYEGSSTGGQTIPPYPSSTLQPAYGAYICYGIYDSNITNPAQRAGYVGRCWKPAQGTMMTCVAKPAVPLSGTGGNATGCDIPSNQTYCNYKDGNTWYRNWKKTGTVAYNYSCSENKESDCTNDLWKPLYIWNDRSGNSCENEGDTQTGTAAGGAWEGQTGNSNQLSTAVENCIVDASIAYCRDTSVPEVIDPSDQAGDTTRTWNVPGVVADSGIISLMGGDYPIATMKGYIQQTTRPQGILHNVQRDLRLGAMAFNYVGASTECQTNYVTPGVTRYCPTGNQDGAKLIAGLEAGDFIVDPTDTEYPGNKRRHVDDLVAAINDVRGTSWTPLGEALYTALGYYTQNDAFRLRDTQDSNNKYLDFCIKTNEAGTTCTNYALDKDPVQYWCQDNHILLITEGESTTDVHPAVVQFASAPTTVNQATFFRSSRTGDDLDGDGTAEPTPTTTTTPVTGPCKDTLFRSTYLDDMTWWGQHVWPTYKSRYFIDPDGNQTQKQNISTYVVATSALNTTAASGAVEECKPETLLRYAASKGGTNSYYPGNDPASLERNLYAVLDDILSRASAGSAASVISSSRSGSGAVYQAVFWPKHEDQSTPTKNKVSWVGDVHSLFVSSAGLMYEDTNQNGKLEAGEDANSNGTLNAGEDINGNGTLDAGADKRVLFYFSTKANRTRGCYDIQGFYTNNMQCPGEPDATPSTPDPRCPATNSTNCVEITDIKYLWSANKRLAKMDVLNERKIWTWNDANNNGRVDDGEQFLLTELASYYSSSTMSNTNTNSTDSAKLTALNTVAQSSGRGPISRDFLTSADLLTFAGYTPQGATETAANYAKRRERESLDGLVKWIQGVDSVTTDETTDANSNGRLDKALRSRAFNLISDDPSDPTNQLSETWRLGDIIHSTPILVAKPAEAYHYIYRDPTYRDFVERWKGRRNMIYFGGNDGMLHAVNGGFYFENNGGQFCCTAVLNSDGSCNVSPDKGSCGTGGKALGQELWAYLPYNLQPHMKCLADKYYAHKYYVDQKPRIFDVQIFEPENACSGGVTAAGCIHPGGWGTILVGSMRFGGAPVKAKDLLDAADSNYNSENRQFTSAYFVLDITDPDAATPRLLGEMTQVLNGSNTLYADMGYTTSSPSLVIMRSSYPNAETSGGTAESTGNVKSEWYLVLGNGPTELDGSHAPQGKIAVMPLSWLNGEVTDWNSGWPKTFQARTDWKQFRIPNTAPTSSSEAGVFTLPTNNNTITSSFISDIIAVDYNINLTAPDDRGARYRTDTIYFGTIDGTTFEPYPSGYLSGIAGQFYWNKGGRVFRMVTKKLNPNGIETVSKPSDWAGMWNDTSNSLKYNNGPLRQLADVKMPVIGAPSIGYDGDNFWVYAGTGRFFSEQDKTDDGWCLEGISTDPTCAKRSKIGFFGLKEPLKDELSSFDYWATLPPSTLDYKYNPMMTWGRIEWYIPNGTEWEAWDINTRFNKDIPVQTVPPSVRPGRRGLMQTDNIIVADPKRSVYVNTNGNVLSYLSCYNCKTNATDRTRYSCTAVSSAANDYCFPNNVLNSISVDGRKTTDPVTSPAVKVPVFDKLRQYIAGTGFMTVDGKHYTTGLDGWYRDFHDARERNLGTSALLGGLLTYTTYQPYNDVCRAEGESSLYGVHYQTGTGWIENVFGTFNPTTGVINKGTEGQDFIMDKLSLGRGLSTTPSMHVGTGDSAAKAFIQTSTGEIIEVSQENLPIKRTKSGRQNWTDRCSQ